MKISEKQILALILLAKNYQQYLMQLNDFDNPMGKFVSCLIDDIREQQSDALKDLNDE